MALAGSLKEFGLADILQLIFYQKKTGNLTLKSRVDTVRVLFNEGNIVLAESSKRRDEGRLGRVLIRKGIVKAADLNAAIEEYKGKDNRLKLGHIILQKGLATREQIQQVLTDQITELVVQLFSWKEGMYEFTAGAVPIDKGIPLSVDTQGLMMESLRIFDEWSIFKGQIDQDSVFVRTSKPDEGLSKEQAELLGYVDGKNDVHKIGALYGQDAFQTAKDMIALVEMGLIEPRPAGAADEEDLLPVREVKQIPGLSFMLAVILLSALALSVAAFAGGTNSNNLDAVRAAEAIDELRYRINIQKHTDGVYPASVDDADQWGRSYIYEPSAEGFVLYSAGPDGVADTKDDVH
jgi:hypothetical protein